MDGLESNVDCLVLVPVDASLSPGLEDDLAARGWTPQIRRDAAEVMAELGLRRQTARTERVFERSEGDLPILVITEPHRWPWHEQLRRAISRYFDDVTVLETAGNGGLPALACDDDPVVADDDRDFDENDETDAERLTLSREEIEMLLETPGDRS